MQIPIFQVDAFTSNLFHGNPAAVCLLNQWLEDDRLQAIAAENNLSETAFLVGRNGEYGLRWFTPKLEVDLCGHATLASAYVIFNHIEKDKATVSFSTKSGILTVDREGPLLSMQFPARPASPSAVSENLVHGLHRRPLEVHVSRDFLAVYASEDEILLLEPSMDALCSLDCLGVIATAPGKKCDFVSRFFAPRAGIPEDPVTGSAHCTLVPYWSAKLGKKNLHARQISARGGELFCEDLGNKIRISGEAVLYLEGFIHI